MKWFKWMALAALGLVLAVGLAWLLFGARVAEYGRRRLVDELSAALGLPLHVGQLSVALLPLVVRADDVRLGPDGAALTIAQLELRPDVVRSLRAYRGVAAVDLRGLRLDVGALLESDAFDEPSTPLPPFDLRWQVEEGSVRMPLGTEPLDLDIAAARGRLRASIFGYLAGDIDAQHVRVRRRSGDVTLRAVTASAAETRAGLRIAALRMDGEDVAITGAALPGRALRHSLHIDAVLDHVAPLDESIAELRGHLRADTTLGGWLSDPSLAGTLAIDGLAWAGRDFGDAQGEVARDETRLALRAVRLQGFGGNVTGDGQIDISGDLPFTVALRWDGIDIARVADAVEPMGLPSLRAKGTLELSGTASPWAVEGRGGGDVAHSSSTKPVRWTGQAKHSAAGSSADVALSEGSANRARADVAVDAQGALRGEVHLDLGDWPGLALMAGVAPLPGLRGTLIAAATLSGTTAAPRAVGRVDGRQVTLWGTRIERLGGGFTVDRAHLESEGLTVGLADDGEVVAAGTVGFDTAVNNTWTVTARAVGIDAVVELARGAAQVSLPLAGGRVSGSLRGEGPWKALQFTGALRADAFAMASEPFQQLTLSAAGTWPDWTVEGLLLHGDDGERADLRASGRGLDEIVGATLSSSEWSLARWAGAEEAGLGGAVQVTAQVRGAPAALDGQVQVSGRALRWGDRALGDTAIAATAQKGRWALTGRALDEKLALTGSVDGAAERFTLDVQWTDAAFAGLLSPDPSLAVQSSGSLQVSGRLAAPLQLDGVLQIPVLDARSGSFHVEAVEPIRIRGAGGTFTIESLALRGNGTELRAAGTLSTAGVARVQVKGQGRLQLLEVIGDPVQSARGRFDLEVMLERAASGPPHLSGRVSFADAALDVGLPFGLTETSGELGLAGTEIRIERFAGRVGGGTVALGGTVDLARGPAVTWQVDQMSTGLLPSLEHEISGRGALEGTWNDLLVRGEVRILRLLYDRRIELGEFLPSFKRQLRPAPESAQSKTKVRLDVTVVAPDGLFIDNNFARLEARTNLHIGGTTDRLRLGGVLDVIDGEVFFRGRTFDLLTGVVDFRPELGLVAGLEFVAESEIETRDGTYTVTVQVTGTTDNYRVTMDSDDPALTRNDVASLIAFGKTSAQLQQEGGGSVSVGGLFGLAPGGYDRKVQQGAAQLLGVDRFEIEPAFSRTTGAFEPQLSIGKDFTEHLTASLASSFGTEGRRVVELEYRLTPRLSLLGSWESETESEAGAFGADVKFRREFRRLSEFSLFGFVRPDVE